MYIPGHGVKVCRFYLAAVDGDKPALASMCGMDKGAGTFGCHLDLYKTNRNSVVYDSAQHTNRDFKLQIDAQTLAELARLRKESRAVVSPAETKLGTDASKFCDKFGLKPYVPAFHGIPTVYDDPHDFFMIFIRDYFHDLVVGIAASILMICLRILKKTQGFYVNTADGPVYPYMNNIGRVDEATSVRRSNRHPPQYRHVDRTTFYEGVPEMILSTACADANVGATGTSANHKSRDLLVRLSPTHVSFHSPVSHGMHILIHSNPLLPIHVHFS